MRAVTDQVWKKKTTKNIPENLAVFSGVFARGEMDSSRCFFF